MKIKKGYVLKEFGGEAMVMPVPASPSEPSVIDLNESATILWKVLEGGCTLDDLTNALTDVYDVSDDKARQSAESFVGRLRERGLIEE